MNWCLPLSGLKVIIWSYIKIKATFYCQGTSMKRFGIILDRLKSGKAEHKNYQEWSLTEICVLTNMFRINAKRLVESALTRICKLMSLERCRTLMKSFIESQFGYCPVVWMFCGRKSNNRINHLHKRALRIVYNDNQSCFENLLRKDRLLSIHHRNIRSIQYIPLPMN